MALVMVGGWGKHRRSLAVLYAIPAPTQYSPPSLALDHTYCGLWLVVTARMTDSGVEVELFLELRSCTGKTARSTSP